MKNAIPMLDLRAQHAPIREEMRLAIDSVLESQAFILGPDVKAFEEEVAKVLGVKHAIGCANGSDALVLALQALGVGPGDEVITTTFSFFATAGAIARLQAVPVFVDVDLATYNLDPRLVEARVTAKTKAILPVHLFGQMTPMDPILAVAKRHGLKVLEDGAQAIGSQENGRAAGSIGDLGTLSFFPSKNLGCFGDGGMVLTQSDDYAAKVRSLRVHGTGKETYHYDFVGMNSRLDTLQAAVLRVKLKYLAAWTEGRRRNAARYDALLNNLSEVVLPVTLPGMFHIYNQYTIRVPRRDELKKRLQEEGIGCAVYYPLSLHLQKCFSALGGRPGQCPNAEKATEEVISIPIFGELTEAQVERVASVIKAHVARG